MKKSCGGALRAVFASLPLAILALGILGTLLSGAGAYKRLVEQSTDVFDKRLGVQYLSARLRQTTAGKNVSVSDFGEGDSLLFCEEINGLDYHTQIYCHEGWLMELFSPAGSGLNPEDGEKIIPVKSLSIDRSDSLLELSLSFFDGSENSFYINLR